MNIIDPNSVGWNVLGILFMQSHGNHVVSHYMGKDLTWWRERTMWYNRMINEDVLPVSEVLLEEFFTVPAVQANAAFMRELDRVYKFWDARPALEDFLCK